jgi:O-antigen/teichoic acid export membrane protein
MLLGDLLKNVPAFSVVAASKLKPVLLYLFSSGIVALVPFIALAIATHYLSLLEMGKVAQYQIVLAIVLAIIGFGSISSVNIKIFELESSCFKIYCFNVFFICLVSGFFLLVIAVFFGSFVSNYFNFDSEILYSAFFVGFACFPVAIILGVYQSKGEVRKHSYIRIVQAFIEYGVFIALVCFFSFESEGRLAGAIIAAVCISLFILYRLHIERFFVFGLDRGYLQHSLNYGFPMMIHGLAGVLLTLGDRLVINFVMGVEELGLYLVAAQLTFALNLLYDSVFKVMHPWVIEKTVSGEFKRAFLSMVGLFIVLALAGVACYPVMYYLYGYVFSGDFSQGSELIFPLMLALIFRSGYYGFAIFINIFSKNKLLAYNTLVSGCLVMVLSYFMAQEYGLIGVAYALVCGEAISFLLAISSSIYLHRYSQIGAGNGL